MAKVEYPHEPTVKEIWSELELHQKLSSAERDFRLVERDSDGSFGRRATKLAAIWREAFLKALRFNNDAEAAAIAQIAVQDAVRLKSHADATDQAALREKAAGLKKEIGV